MPSTVKTPSFRPPATGSYRLPLLRTLHLFVGMSPAVPTRNATPRWRPSSRLRCFAIRQDLAPRVGAGPASWHSSINRIRVRSSRCWPRIRSRRVESSSVPAPRVGAVSGAGAPAACPCMVLKMLGPLPGPYHGRPSTPSIRFSWLFRAAYVFRCNLHCNGARCAHPGSWPSPPSKATAAPSKRVQPFACVLRGAGLRI